jgi:hypothetical protein
MPNFKNYYSNLNEQQITDFPKVIGTVVDTIKNTPKDPLSLAMLLGDLLDFSSALGEKLKEIDDTALKTGSDLTSKKQAVEKTLSLLNTQIYFVTTKASALARQNPMQTILNINTYPIAGFHHPELIVNIIEEAANAVGTKSLNDKDLLNNRFNSFAKSLEWEIRDWTIDAGSEDQDNELLHVGNGGDWCRRIAAECQTVLNAVNVQMEKFNKELEKAHESKESAHVKLKVS